MKVKENILSSTKWVESADNKSQPAAFQFQLLDLCEVIPGLKHLLKGDNYQLSSLVHLLDSSVGPAAQHVTQRVRPYRHWKVLTLFSQHIKQYIQKHWGEMEEVNDPFHTRPLGPCHFSVWNEIWFFHTKGKKIMPWTTSGSRHICQLLEKTLLKMLLHYWETRSSQSVGIHYLLIFFNCKLFCSLSKSSREEYSTLVIHLKIRFLFVYYIPLSHWGYGAVTYTLRLTARVVKGD